MANNGSFSWLIPTSLAPAGNYIIRITRNTTSAVGSNGPFTINGQIHIYYVNDGTVVSGDLTSAPGNDANSGLDPAHPKASIQGVLAEYTLGAGDIIELDRGIYDLTTNIVVGAADAGVTIKGYQTASNGGQWASSVSRDRSQPISIRSAVRPADSRWALATCPHFSADPPALGFTHRMPHHPSGPFSFETWLYPTSTNDGTIFDFVQYDKEVPPQIVMRFTFGRDGFGNDLAISGTFGNFTLPNVLRENIWQFIAITITSDGHITFYRNGQSVGTGKINAAPGMDPSQTAALLGDNITSPNFGYQGRMQEAAFFNGAETPTDSVPIFADL